MASKNRHKIRFWDDSYVQQGFTRVRPIVCDKLDNAQCTLCNTMLKRHKELKYKENTDSVQSEKSSL